MESRSQASPRAPAGSGRTRSRRASPRTNRFSSRSSSTTPLPRGSAAIGGGVALAQAIWFASDPFGMVHAEAQIAIVGLTATALLAVGFRRSVPLLFLLGYMLKGAALFHPSYFYPDVRLHRRHLEAFEAASGGILERGGAAQ